MIKKRYNFICLLLFILCHCHQPNQETGKMQTSGAEASWKTLEQGSILLSYPPSWQYYSDTLQSEKIHIYRRDDKDTSLFLYDLSITPMPKYYKDGNGSFNEFTRGQMEQMAKLYSLTIVKEEHQPLNSRNAWQVLAWYPTDAGRRETARICFVEGSYEDIMIFAAGESSREEEAGKIIQTIKVK